jgi:hypothetical protein
VLPNSRVENELRFLDTSVMVNSISRSFRLENVVCESFFLFLQLVAITSVSGTDHECESCVESYRIFVTSDV